MAEVVFLLIGGLTSGSIYALVALAFSTLYSATKVVNFGQGEFCMFGAMLAVPFVLNYHFPVYVAIPAIALIVGFLGVFMEISLVNPLINKLQLNTFITIIGTLAFGTILRYVAALIWGERFFGIPPIFKTEYIKAGSIQMETQSIVIIISMLLIVSFLWYFLNKTFTGKAITAMASNRTAASLVGINIRKQTQITFFIGSAIAGITGYLVSPIQSASAWMGFSLSVKGFIAAIVGGLGNPFAAVGGGIIIGLLEQFSGAYITTAYKDAIVFGMMLIVLLFRPLGIFGEKEL